MAATFRIVLTDTDGFEGIVARRFDLAVGSTIRIGRASRSTQKKDLMPDTHNAFIDSPVISRDHAVLSANPDGGVPRVFITDTKSMHGTFVNGIKLVAGSPTQLKTGDVIQFGINVNRNEEYFVARKYHFEATRVGVQESYSLGFAVPESEEEDIAGTPSPRQGSQSDPLTIDDSESESDVSDNDPREVTYMGEGFIVEEPEDPEDYHPAQIDIHITDNVSIEEKYSDDEDSAGDYPSDVPEEDDIGNNSDNSDAASIGDSAFGDKSDADPSENEADDKHDPDVAGNQTASEGPAAEDSAGISMPWLPFSAPFVSMPPNFGSELPSMTLSSMMNNFQPAPPPLPPRPTPVRPNMFYRSEMSTSRQGWWPDEMNSTPNYMGTNHGDRPSLFSPAPPPTTIPSAVQETEPAISIFGGNSANFAPIDGRMQTPPPMPSSDIISSTPPPPNRRTKVSITEIVEDQPPTPTSVNSISTGTKRKADVMEHEEEEQVSEAMEIVITSSQDDILSNESAAEQPTDSAVDSAAEAAAQAAAIIAQRPKKQPKSVLRKLRNSATYVGYGAAGAAGAFALLVCLPDAFFA